MTFLSNVDFGTQEDKHMKEEPLPFVCAIFAIICIGLAVFTTIYWILPGLVFVFLTGMTALARGSDN